MVGHRLMTTQRNLNLCSASPRCSRQSAEEQRLLSKFAPVNPKSPESKVPATKTGPS